MVKGMRFQAVHPIFPSFLWLRSIENGQVIRAILKYLGICLMRSRLLPINCPDAGQQGLYVG